MKGSPVPCAPTPPDVADGPERPTIHPDSGPDERSLVALGLAEFIETAVFVLLGISALIGVTAVLEPVEFFQVSGGLILFRFSLGLGFGLGAMMVIASPLGKFSGGHVNPAVSLAVWFRGEMSGRAAMVYMVAQCAGSIPGALFLHVWGHRVSADHYGATVPDPGVPLLAPFLSELVATGILVACVILIIDKRVKGVFAFFLIPLAYAVMAAAGAGVLSGVSTNPARTLGPAVVSGVHQDLWLYFTAPFIGAVLAVLIASGMRRRSSEREDGAQTRVPGPALCLTTSPLRITIRPR